ncbi:Cof-type HAD-IIB family hydrolase [Paenibacillus sp. FJAT-26967]|uniref:Cof-type HAD-IIB family hydrolase n=1 Tax=Paenibacillus sp. FJAT-26967 TaxID=1729690 RepID=UPI0008399C8C|nr:Cof-type HAD-IIB family hydrolase [Paenibacillus sp. FJAT-26967]
MERSIVFFDIDGTLLDEDKQIPDSTRKAVRMLQERGVFTAIATGRNPVMFENILEELNIDSFVSINGQYVVFEGRELYTHPMDTDKLAELVQRADEQGHSLAYCGHPDIRVSSLNPHVMESYEGLKLPCPDAEPDFYKHSPVFQGHLFCDAESEKEYAKLFPHYRFVRWHEHAVDVLPEGSSKAIGILEMLKAVGIPNENCYAFGDGLNDIEMLASVGTGIAMGNAVPETKAAADYVTSSCSEDGILRGLIAVGLLPQEALV